MSDVVDGDDASLDPWRALRRLTAARIALGHTGVSQPTRAQLDFQLAHARARDAVHQALDTADLMLALDAAWPGLPSPLLLHSVAESRNVYLQRPDLGRRLDAPSRSLIAARLGGANEGPCDLSIVVADGLSALAVMQNAAPLLRALRGKLETETWALAPLAIVQQGRVAVGDEIGDLLGANIVVVMIGERPGLSSPDSMGLYITWAPRVGLTDERRNCISNVRPAGLGHEDAAHKLHYLLTEARKRQLTGVGLKDEMGDTEVLMGSDTRPFLL
ncbi:MULTISPECIES: ethanolamine ammonia-lyase subunit EutC [unclassified Massilia]|uniref:ethanolamine ammonia-lyase subunit EutC n=1 Tax=unclassified Massilia TaxID=2609279 RepID=UPI001780EA58|nr:MULTISPECIES: ethanolamine ammonia-lyase subunit EutC [unclassified Massilia]MBD8533237.1 ethanolamine ammonia-lyase subunit EutC [Massilia sp. CFBP 13647]MBD8672065.1 ethanolamine ammonia-lyase subunit EutC [Massilia sp. CFBP 13721]